jgi:hypothetical protein
VKPLGTQVSNHRVPNELTGEQPGDDDRADSALDGHRDISLDQGRTRRTDRD